MRLHAPQFVLFLLICCTIVSSAKKNVLFIAVDDLRPQLNCYEGSTFPSPVHPTMHTPNIDKLANDSLLLRRAYVQLAVCNPSRASLLTGRRPDTTRVYNLNEYFRLTGGNFTTIPQYFKENGYEAIGMGKIFHPGTASGNDDPISWSEPYFHANNSFWRGPRSSRSWRAVNSNQYLPNPLPDQQVATQAINVLRRVGPAAKANPDKPFFVAVGFHKPHLPFLFPEEYLQHYPEANIKLPPNPHVPQNFPNTAWFNYIELRNYNDIQALGLSGDFNTTLPDDVTKELRRAYYASVSYSDDMVGKVLNELDSLGLRDDTVVVLWGDHGWQLGEHSEWAKNTNFELAVQAPLMFRIPGKTDGGIDSHALVEFVDMFPTLAEAAGLPAIPQCPQDSSNVLICHEGVSLMPLVSNPNQKWKTGGFSQFLKNRDTMGYSIRTDRFRYTAWIAYDGRTHQVDWNSVTARELYDHQSDPDENFNVASEAQYQSQVAQLHSQLQAGWRAALPQNVISTESSLKPTASQPGLPSQSPPPSPTGAAHTLFAHCPLLILAALLGRFLFD
eukprot:m.180700 g.180700  ORF g.180700 m.180700 type:complete len:558 (+) comp39259_c0_seq1:47-1720(+)